MFDFTPLDNPVWFALKTQHQSIARAHGLARRYPSDVSPLSAIASPTPAAFDDLAELVAPGETVALFTTESLDVPSSWGVTMTQWIYQMICAEMPAALNGAVVALRENDVPEMLELTAATKPGPFLPGTIRMGTYFGIRSDDGRLIAMAGERLRLNGFTEVSAVCCHPDHRGRGHAGVLVSHVASQNFGSKRTPFLHVKTENVAKRLYEKLGFRVRRQICVTVISRR